MNLVRLKGKALASEQGFVAEVIESEGNPRLIGKIAFVDDLLPGEVGEAQVVKENKNFINADLIQHKELSPQRIKAQCQYFNSCGGCSLQQLSSMDQLTLKINNLKINYFKMTGQALDQELFLSRVEQKELPNFNYRKRIRLHYRGGQLGFFSKGSNEIVEIKECLISQELVNQFLAKIIQIKFSEKTQQFLAGIIIDQISDNDCILSIELSSELSKKIKDNDIKQIVADFADFKLLQVRCREELLYQTQEVLTATGHFSQVNLVGNQVLIDLIKQNILVNPRVTELYAGAGNFTFSILDQVEKITAIEVDPTLTEIAKQIANSIGKNKCKIITSSAEKYCKEAPIREVLLLDPPRDGAKQVLQQADLSKTKQIIYISCNPASWCRDAKILLEKDFKLQQVIPVDMFPQTHHLEVFSVFASK